MQLCNETVSFNNYYKSNYYVNNKHVLYLCVHDIVYCSDNFRELLSAVINFILYNAHLYVLHVYL